MLCANRDIISKYQKISKLRDEVAVMWSHHRGSTLEYHRWVILHIWVLICTSLSTNGSSIPRPVASKRALATLTLFSRIDRRSDSSASCCFKSAAVVMLYKITRNRNSYYLCCMWWTDQFGPCRSVWNYFWMWYRFSIIFQFYLYKPHCFLYFRVHYHAITMITATRCPVVANFAGGFTIKLLDSRV